MKLLEHFHKLSIYPKNAKELKSLVLQLAVQGKLTADWRLANPDVEPAAVLLERIKAEKEALIKAKKIKKEKKIGTNLDIEIKYEIPTNWVWCRFQEIVINRDGERVPLSKEIRKTRQGKYDYYGASKVIDKVDDYIFDEDLLLIGEDGANLINRSTPIAFFARGKYWVNNHAHVIDSIEFGILEFLEKYINSISLEDYITGMAQPKMPQKRMNIIKVPLPPLQEQKAIVKVVDTLLQEVAQLEQLTQQRLQLKEKYVTAALNQVCEENRAKAWTDLKEQFSTFFNEERNIKKLRETILQLAVQGKLTANWRAANPDVEPAAVLLERIKVHKLELIKTKKIKKEKPLPVIEADEVPYGVPEGWTWCRLRDIGTTQTGATPSKGNPDFYGDFIPFIGPAHISNSGISYPKSGLSRLGLEKGRLIPKNSLMMVCIGGSIGKCYTNIIEVSCNQQINVVTSCIVLPFYTQIIAQSPYFQKKTISKASGSATPIINKGKWEKIKIPLPPIQEQKAIVEKVNQLMDFCDNLEQEVIKSKETAAALMQVVLKEVFDGQEVETV